MVHFFMFTRDYTHYCMESTNYVENSLLFSFIPSSPPEVRGLVPYLPYFNHCHSWFDYFFHVFSRLESKINH